MRRPVLAFAPALALCLAAAQASAQDLEFRIFDVQNLVHPVSSQPVPESFDTKDAPPGISSMYREEPRGFIYESDLREMVLEAVTPEGEEPEAEGSFVKYINGRLFVRKPPADVAAIERLLLSLEREALRSVCMEVLVFKPSASANPPDTAADRSILDDGAVAAILERCRAAGAAPARFALSGLSGQTVSLSDGNEENYVSDYEYTGEEAQPVMPNPAISTLKTGMSVSLTPTLSSVDGSSVLTVLFTSSAGLGSAGPFEVKDTPGGKVLMPCTAFSRLASTAAVSHGKWLMLRVPSHAPAAPDGKEPAGHDGSSEYAIFVRAIQHP